MTEDETEFIERHPDDPYTGLAYEVVSQQKGFPGITAWKIPGKNVYEARDSEGNRLITLGNWRRFLTFLFALVLAGARVRIYTYRKSYSGYTYDHNSESIFDHRVRNYLVFDDVSPAIELKFSDDAPGEWPSTLSEEDRKALTHKMGRVHPPLGTAKELTPQICQGSFSPDGAPIPCPEQVDISLLARKNSIGGERNERRHYRPDCLTSAPMGQIEGVS